MEEKINNLSKNSVPQNVHVNKERNNISVGSKITDSSQYSTAVGIDALEALTTGVKNTALGKYTMSNTTTGQKKIVLLVTKLCGKIKVVAITLLLVMKLYKKILVLITLL
jgi:hypothetical protein